MFTIGADIAVANGRLRICRDGSVVKFIDAVEHITFSGARAQASGQSVLYVTERCVLRLGSRGLELIEVAPGVDLERDVLAKMSFRPEIATHLHEMDAAIFNDAPLGLNQRPPRRVEPSIAYHAEDDLVLLTLDGLATEAPGEPEAVLRSLDRRLREMASSHSVIVDCGGFDIGHPGANRFLQLLREYGRSRSWAWYSSDALRRRELSRACSDNDASQPMIHPSFRHAGEALREARMEASPRTSTRPRGAEMAHAHR